MYLTSDRWTSEPHGTQRKAGGGFSGASVTILVVDLERLRAALIGQTGQADTCVFMFSPATVGYVRFFPILLPSSRASVPR